MSFGHFVERESICLVNLSPANNVKTALIR